MNGIHIYLVTSRFTVVVDLYVYKTTLQKIQQEERIDFKILIDVFRFKNIMSLGSTFQK